MADALIDNRAPINLASVNKITALKILDNTK